jgi:hypothetical protein
MWEAGARLILAPPAPRHESPTAGIDQMLQEIVRGQFGKGNHRVWSASARRGVGGDFRSAANRRAQAPLVVRKNLY